MRLLSSNQGVNSWAWLWNQSDVGALKGDIARSIKEDLGVVVQTEDGYKYFPSLDSRGDFFQAMSNYGAINGGQVQWFQLAADVTNNDLKRTEKWPCTMGACGGVPAWTNEVGRFIMKSGWKDFQDFYDHSSVLTGDAAKQWDTARLSTEQKSAQPYYDQLESNGGYSWLIVRGVGVLATGSVKSVFELDNRINYGEEGLDKLHNRGSNEK